jgi:hypothetical protein
MFHKYSLITPKSAVIGGPLKFNSLKFIQKSLLTAHCSLLTAHVIAFPSSDPRKQLESVDVVLECMLESVDVLLECMLESVDIVFIVCDALNILHCHLMRSQSNKSNFTPREKKNHIYNNL